MSTGYPNSENKWDAVNDIIRSKYKSNDLHSQTTDLYDMEYIPLSKEKCTYVGMLCVKYCEEMVDPSCIGYKCD